MVLTKAEYKGQFGCRTSLLAFIDYVAFSKIATHYVTATIDEHLETKADNFVCLFEEHFYWEVERFTATGDYLARIWEQYFESKSRILCLNRRQTFWLNRCYLTWNFAPKVNQRFSSTGNRQFDPMAEDFASTTQLVTLMLSFDAL